MFDEHHVAHAGMLRRVTVVAVDDKGTQQRLTLTGLASEQFDKVVRLQPHGFTSVPPAGSEGVLLPMGGRSDRAHVLGLEHKDKRPTGLPGGATALYDADGNIIKMIGKDGVKFGFDDHKWTTKSKGLEIDASGDHVVIKTDRPITIHTSDKVWVGGDEGDGQKVLTVAGPSQNVFAKV